MAEYRGKIPGQRVRASFLLPQKGLAEVWGGRLDRPGTFLGISLTSHAFPFDSQGPVELGGEVFHLQFPAKGKIEIWITWDRGSKVAPAAKFHFQKHYCP